jgi:hypothetical protein
MPAYVPAAYVRELYSDGLRVEQTESAQLQYERSALAVHKSELNGVMNTILDDTLKAGKSARLVHIVNDAGHSSSSAAQ